MRLFVRLLLRTEFPRELLRTEFPRELLRQLCEQRLFRVLLFRMDHEASGKRKRSPQSPSSPPTNRPRRNPVETTAPPCRQPLQTLLQILTLLKAALPGDGPFEDAWYDTVLEHARSDKPQAKRLAAQLLIRMAPKYPGKIETTVAALINISAWRPETRSEHQRSLCEETRFKALAIFDDMLDWTTLEVRPQFMKIILHLFR